MIPRRPAVIENRSAKRTNCVPWPVAPPPADRSGRRCHEEHPIIAFVRDHEKQQSENGDSAKELQALRQERDSLYDQLLRKQAEFENYRKAVDREKTEYVQHVCHDLMRNLLP